MGLNQRLSFAVYANIASNGTFGTQDKMFRDLARLSNESNMDFFVITPGFLNEKNTDIEGYRLSDEEDKKWVTDIFPIPQVVLRRLVHYSRKQKNQVLLEEEWLENQSRMITLPRHLGSKWSTHQRLYKEPQLRGYLPKTQILRRKEDLLPFLEETSDVYIKPVLGTQGRSVMRLKKDSEGYSLVANQMQEGIKSHDLQSLIHEINERLKGQLAVVQKTVPLLKTANGESVDLRFLVQACPMELQCQSIPIARVGNVSNVTTNIHTGGKAYSSRKLAQLLDPEKHALWWQGLASGRVVARKVFQVFQKEYPLLSELGIDLAIDEEGQVYFLEINPCPGRRMLRSVSPEWRMRSIQRIVNYASFIAVRTY